MSNQAQRDALTLVIRNIDAIEEAARLANSEELVKPIFDAIDERIEMLAEKQGMAGNFNLWVDLSSDFHPAAWKATPRGGEEAIPAAYVWYSNSVEGENELFLASLCGVGSERMGFGWNLSKQFFNKRFIKSFLHEANKLQVARELEALGFRYDATTLYWHFEATFNPEALAAAVNEDLLVDALAPIDNGMEKVRQAMPHFNGLVERAIQAFSTAT
jgi:hypothetical protein